MKHTARCVGIGACMLCVLLCLLLPSRAHADTGAQTDEVGTQVAASQDDTAVSGDVSSPVIRYRAHVQSYGWQDWVGNDAVAGTVEKSKRLEAVEIEFEPRALGSITYRTHCQSLGWLPWRANGVTSGTIGQAKRLEAIEIKLTGQAAREYNVWYRVYCQTRGWQDWVGNGATAGTMGQKRRVEAIQIQVRKKGEQPPNGAKSLIYLDAGHGLSGARGYDPGVRACDGSSEADMTKELTVLVAKYARETYGLNVYVNTDCNKSEADRQAHAKSVGATSLVSLHFNGANNSLAHGIESVVYDGEGSHPGMAAPRSKTLQEIMHRHLRESLAGLYDYGARSAAIPVVDGVATNIPSVLLNVCFITNEYDYESYVRNKDQVAQELAKGLHEAYCQGF